MASCSAQYATPMANPARCQLLARLGRAVSRGAAGSRENSLRGQPGETNTSAPALIAAIASITLLGIPVYATLAFRGAYGGSITRTLAKEAAIGAIYAATTAVAFVTMIYWISLLD